MVLSGVGDAQVRNGRIAGFSYGVYAWGAGAKTVRGVTLEATSTGVAAHGDMFDENEADVRLVGSTVTGAIRGVSVSYLRRVEITGSTVSGNNWGADLGWNGTAVVSRSTFADNATGYRGALATARVERSTFTGNDVGVSSGFLHALELTGSTFTGNGTGYTDDPDVSDAPVDTLTRNTFTGNGDGVVSDDSALALGSNKAIRNTGWGIHAPNATDLGGNRAHGNGNDPQCVGVVCRAS